MSPQEHDQAKERIQALSKDLTMANTALLVLQKQMVDKKREVREAEMRARMVTEGPQLHDLMARTVRKVRMLEDEDAASSASLGSASLVAAPRL